MLITPGVSSESRLDKTLFASTNFPALIVAVALVKPSRSLNEVDAKSVCKRMKDKAFARSVSRDDIINGAAALDVALEEHILR